MLSEVRGKYRKNTDIGKISWFKTSNIIDTLYMPRDIDDLEYFLVNKPPFLQIYVIGAGSNILIRSNKISGAAVKLGIDFSYVKCVGAYITVGCACLNSNLVKYATINSISGFEFLTGIPGTIGGALSMNAGSYGSDISSILIEAKAINIMTGKTKIFYLRKIGYYYRGGRISKNWLFYEGKFKGYKKEKKQILNTINFIEKKRLAAQPRYLKTCGSTFKNPFLQKAWILIKSCGLADKKIGSAKFSNMHCNFLTNLGKAKSFHLESLIQLAQIRVKEKFNISLKQEIRFISNY